MYLSYQKRKLTNKETPQVVFEKLKGDYSFLLQSGGEERYSFVGYEPDVILQKNGPHLIEISFNKGRIVKRKKLQGDVMKHIVRLNRKYAVTNSLLELPPFIGGASGFFSYDFGVEMAGVKVKTKALVACPEVYFVWVKKLIAFDHQKKQLWFLALSQTALKDLLKDYNATVVNQNHSDSSIKVQGGIVSNFSLAAYKKCIVKIKRFLSDGETYQVNFAQQFTVKSRLDPWQVYKKLFKINPSSQACFFNHPDFCVISASPERLVSVHDDVVETWPIKGTIRRGKTASEDDRNIRNLLASLKNKAELAMIVDLSRNDIGKVCKPGTVGVVKHRAIMKLSHVIHTYSIVRGNLKKNKACLDVFKALFPGGSITGCPKKRTMEIIARLEMTKRGVYCGSAGYFSASNNMDFNIMIRTLFYQDGNYYFGAGGGIVVDSDPRAEYQESLDKAEALKKSLA